MAQLQPSNSLANFSTRTPIPCGAGRWKYSATKPKHVVGWMRHAISSAVNPLKISSQPEMLPSSGAFSKFSSASITASFHKRTMEIYRMHRSVRATGDYIGAMLAGGRWNPIGTPMLYTAQHLSLACIEILVHLD